jgi:LPXTG-motif cell wall-anchored protein
VDDDVTTDEGEPIRIDVLANDTSNDPDTTVSLVSGVAHGQAELVGEPAPPPRGEDGRVGTRAVPAAGTQAVVYTPQAGFTGTDTFTYRLTNSNGSRTATVTVDVVGEAVPTPPSTDVDPDTPDPGTDPTPPSAQLPDTGGSDVRLLGLGGLLVAAGAMLARGRRREDVA